jgi:hypothetical protein
VYWIGFSGIDGALAAGAFQHRSPVASHNAAVESASLQRQGNRTANQTGPDNRDLADSHD